MEKWLEESLELMPGRARGNWSLNESVAGAPGAFASSDGPEPTLDGQVAELLDMVRNPTWEYPKWALPKVALDESMSSAQRKVLSLIARNDVVPLTGLKGKESELEVLKKAGFIRWSLSEKGYAITTKGRDALA